MRDLPNLKWRMKPHIGSSGKLIAGRRALLDRPPSREGYGSSSPSCSSPRNSPRVLSPTMGNDSSDTDSINSQSPHVVVLRRRGVLPPVVKEKVEREDQATEIFHMSDDDDDVSEQIKPPPQPAPAPAPKEPLPQHEGMFAMDADVSVAQAPGAEAVGGEAGARRTASDAEEDARETNAQELSGVKAGPAGDTSRDTSGVVSSTQLQDRATESKKLVTSLEARLLEDATEPTRASTSSPRPQSKSASSIHTPARSVHAKPALTLTSSKSADTMSTQDDSGDDARGSVRASVRASSWDELQNAEMQQRAKVQEDRDAGRSRPPPLTHVEQQRAALRSAAKPPKASTKKTSKPKQGELPHETTPRQAGIADFETV
jgi:hypothetical protein